MFLSRANRPVYSSSGPFESPNCRRGSVLSRGKNVVSSTPYVGIGSDRMPNNDSYLCAVTVDPATTTSRGPQILDHNNVCSKFLVGYGLMCGIMTTGPA